jgi:predicted nucleotidyltransferase
MKVEDKYIEIAKNKVLNLIDKDTTSVFLFGSRADNSFTNDSDLDIGFLSDKKINLLLFHKIREELDNSIVPYSFDLVDFYDADQDFKKIALENMIVWNKSKNFS